MHKYVGLAACFVVITCKGNKVSTVLQSQPGVGVDLYNVWLSSAVIWQMSCQQGVHTCIIKISHSSVQVLTLYTQL